MAKIVLVLMLFLAASCGCGSGIEGSDAVPPLSTPVFRDSITLKELERQTETLRRIERELANDVGVNERSGR
jgi:hypothetical protein